jgi:hypothetical protein
MVELAIFFPDSVRARVSRPRKQQIAALHPTSHKDAKEIENGENHSGRFVGVLDRLGR